MQMTRFRFKLAIFASGLLLASIAFCASVLIVALGVFDGAPTAAQSAENASFNLRVEAADQRATLFWDAPAVESETVASYQFQQSVDGGAYGDWQDIVGGADARSHLVSALKNGDDYGFRVRAVFASGEFSAPSAEARAFIIGLARLSVARIDCGLSCLTTALTKRSIKRDFKWSGRLTG